ncbi:acyl-coenzyme A diphosphatase Fitm [Leptinotarsa decemlineata]|uniref:acyl-coenzyme A diphosphatase Fitm n=1 Tax=Leptinotarsa decemlineata TaxID=7539 RepID=UPI003D3088EC
MVTKRRPIHATNLNFRPNLNNSNNVEQKGTKPTSEPTSVKEIFILMVLYICKKSLFFNTDLKVCIYLGCLFVISLIADVLTIPKTYLSRSDNIFNKFFVKFAWGWNLTLVLPFVILTSFIYCCGNKQKIVKQHLPRVATATFFWWFWTTLFNFIEASLGRCANNTFNVKADCLQSGSLWNGFDLSGHSFILIYGSLFLVEESRCIMNWDTIKEHIRLEEHNRMIKDNKEKSNPLRHLSEKDLRQVKENYEKFTPYIRLLFVCIAAIQILWDVMLLSTMFYYHIMIEKFLGGALAILTWFFTYRIWYVKPFLIPNLPGEGEFKYMKSSTTSPTPVRIRRKESLIDQGPRFMGRPIYGNVKVDETLSGR